MLNDQLVGGMLSSSLVPVFRLRTLRIAGALARIQSGLHDHLSVSGGATFPGVDCPVGGKGSGKVGPRILGSGHVYDSHHFAGGLSVNIAGLFSPLRDAAFRFPFLPALSTTPLWLPSSFSMGAARCNSRWRWGCWLRSAGGFQIPGLRGQPRRRELPFQLKGLFPLHPALLQMAKLYLPIRGRPSGRPGRCRAEFQPCLANGSNGRWMKYAALIRSHWVGRHRCLSPSCRHSRACRR